MLVLPTANALDIYKVLSFSERIIHQATVVKIKAQTINSLKSERVTVAHIPILVAGKMPWQI